ncbi:hypothetical protein LINGRAHAP2_LOCUS11438 [Linum grandiflorum]
MRIDYSLSPTPSRSISLTLNQTIGLYRFFLIIPALKFVLLDLFVLMQLGLAMKISLGSLVMNGFPGEVQFLLCRGLRTSSLNGIKTLLETSSKGKECLRGN